MASFRMNFPDEIQYLSKYAPEAKTEFDAISRGLEIAFDLEDNFVEEKSIHTNENLSWAVRKYNNRVFSIAAPSSIPTKRANTIDTFEFFMKKFDIKEGDRILLLTASIFVPYQLFRFIPIAIEHGLEVDCLGIGDMSDGVEFLKTSNYLQEIRATVNAIVNLKDRYLYNLTK